MSNNEYFDITDEQLDSFDFKDKVIIVTGGSSGIGLATVSLFSSYGAKVVLADVNPPPSEFANTTFVQTDVSSWDSLLALFDNAISTHGRIDHVVANAGLGQGTRYLALETGRDNKLVEPSHRVIDVNLIGAINTATLGLHYIIRNQQGAGEGNATKGKGSVIMTTSLAAYYYHSSPDYALSKHGLVGFMRGILAPLRADHPGVRLNCVAPHLTESGIIKKEFLEDMPKSISEALNMIPQSPDAVARSIALLAGDETKIGCNIYSKKGKYKEIDRIFVGIQAEIMGSGPTEPEAAWDTLIMARREMMKRAMEKMERAKEASSSGS